MSGKPIRIMRARHDNKFFSVSRRTAQDRQLSWEARGILCYLLSQADEWEVQPKDLEQGCSHNKVYKLLKELREARYIKLIDVRDEKKRITSYYYEVYETPYPEIEDEKLFTQKQQAALQKAEKLQAGNGYVKEYKEEQNTKKERGSDEQAVNSFSDLDLQAYRHRHDYYHAFEAGYPLEAKTKVADTERNKNHARDIFLAGYNTDEVTQLVREKIEQGKADYRFHYLMADLSQARLERNPVHVQKKTPPEVINAGAKLVPAETNWKREPAEAGGAL